MGKTVKAKAKMRSVPLPNEPGRQKIVDHVSAMTGSGSDNTKERRTRAGTLATAIAINDGSKKATETLRELATKYLDSIEQQKQLSVVISKCGKMIDTLVELL